VPSQVHLGLVVVPLECKPHAKILRNVRTAVKHRTSVANVHFCHTKDVFSSCGWRQELGHTKDVFGTRN
jgi:hypothetical protein